jgi:hypothetical protein
VKEMPRRDGTGPIGQGAMTGRGMGICNGGDNIQYGYGVGYGRRTKFNCRRGFSRYYGAGAPVFQQLDSLKEQKELLERRLKEINNQLDQLDK